MHSMPDCQMATQEGGLVGGSEHRVRGAHLPDLFAKNPAR